MNGKRERFLSFVGAMKIARNPTVSQVPGRMVQLTPGSLSEGAAERSEAEGVSFDERKRSKVSEPIRVFV